MTRRKGAQTNDGPLPKTSGEQKRFPRPQEDIPTEPPPPMTEEESGVVLSSPPLRKPPNDLDTATSHLRRRFDLQVALEKKRAQLAFIGEEPREGIPTPRPRLPMSCVPRRAVSRREMLALPLDHRDGFILTHIDGETNVRTIIDLCGMPEADVCAVLERLLSLHVIVLA